MGVDRGGVPDGREALDQITRRDDVDAELPDELDRPGIDARNVGNRALRRIFHRHAPHARDEPLDARFELVASGVAVARSRQVRKRVAFDGVHEPAGLAAGG